MSAAAVAASPPAAPRPPSSPAWLGGFRDLGREHGFEPLRVEGKLPEALRGTLYRNGPGRFGMAGERYRHWFDGDGAVTAVRFGGGRALGAARVVRTAGLVREERAGKRLFGAYDTPLKRPVREILFRDGKNPANTSVLLWQGRLFATCEAGRPYELAVDDLSTLAESDLAGVVVEAFSAHAHRVPSRRCTYNFGFSRGRRTTVDVYALPDEGRAHRLARFDIDGIRMNHDFVVTERHVVFLFAPMYLSLLDMVLWRKGPVSSARWDAERGTEIVVVPIDAPRDIRRFHVDAFLLEHVVNAFEDGGNVIVDYTHYASARALEGFVSKLTEGRIAAPLTSSIRRAKLDVARGTMASEVVLGDPVELPRVSPRVDATRHRFAYYMGFASTEQDAPFGALLKHDTQAGRVERYAPGAAEYPGEGVFVPRPDGSGDEDDGWLLSFVYDAKADRTRLDVLDARGVADGPVARCHFDQAIPFGFHGAWDTTTPA